MAFKSINGGGSSNMVDRVVSRVQSAAEPALLRGALLLEAEVKTLLLTPGRGRIRRSRIDRLGKGSFTTKAGVRRLVRRGVPRTKIDLTDRASLPGDPPAPDSGTLQRSVTHDVRTPRNIRVGTNVEYAPILEYGGKPRGSKRSPNAGRAVVGALIGGLAPRPFMRPAIAKVRPLLGTEIASEVRRGLRNGR